MDRDNNELQELLMDGRSKNYVYAEYAANRERRVVDFVLVHEIKETEELNEQTNGTETKEATRKTYEGNLENAGLKLERRGGIFCKNARFTLVHAPFDLLKEQAEALGIKMPFQEDNLQKNERTIKLGCLDRCLDRLKFLKFDEKKFKQLEEPHFFTRPFIKERLESYVGHENHDTFFESADRSRMVYDLLLRTTYGDNERQVGVEKLLSNGTYTAAYPLHLSLDQSRYKEDESNDRELLYWCWCKNYFKYLPLSLMKDYSGSKIAIYFAWLGIYTRILCPAAVLGVICTVYGMATVSSDIPSNDICASDGIGAEVMMCPHCYLSCSFTSLSASCFYTKVTYVFDNHGTVLFAAMMSILPTLFLKPWKRYYADISRKSGLLDFEVDEQTNRPDYERRASRRFNSATKKEELHIPPLTMSRFAVFGLTVFTFLVVVIAIVFGVTVCRAIVLTVMYEMNGLKRYAPFLTFSTAASINLVVILILNQVYTWIAVKLTDWECHQFQFAYDNSYTIKVYLFQFFNCYSSIFYIAFFKRNAPSRTGGDFLNMKPEECDAAGCMVELVIHLAIIMVGKQLWNFFCDCWPKIMNKIRQWQAWIPQTSEDRSKQDRLEERIKMQLSNEVKNWEQDYVLNPVDELFLFDEYLEMVIQFGFVFLFASAFPLAALFALIRNTLKIHTVAQKYIVHTRRPNPQHLKDIGIWLTILNRISHLAVFSNALIIAFTGDFIPKLVYRTVYQHENLYGYVNNSLSYYDATAVLSSTHFDSNITVCRYRDYRHPPCSVVPTDGCAAVQYNHTEQWWIVLTFRFVFVVMFVVLISAVKTFVVPKIRDMPSINSKQLQRQRNEVRKQRVDMKFANRSWLYEWETTTDESESAAEQKGPFSDTRWTRN